MTVPQEVDRLTREFGWSSCLLGPHADGTFSLDSSRVSSSYTSDQMEELDEGDGGWWYQTRNQVVQSVLREHPVDGFLWEVGSGSGLVTKSVIESGGRAVAIEPSTRGAQLSAQRGVPSINGVLQDLRLPADSLAGVGMFDVLEHLTHRNEMLSEVHRLLKPNGKLYLTLPALQPLWSQFDVDAGHHLRYSKRMIQRELREAGFEVVKVKYFFLLSLPVVFLVRAVPFRLGRKQLVATGTMLRSEIGVLGKVATALELWWSKVGLIGTSLLVVARKP
ncbi:MAG: class I SAM-dependent methyltransferase [Ilumatobacteraceae bacterium]